ncbi:MAG: hypothetical protein ACQER6_10290 [Pseudomonadota bacterium]
MTDQRIIERMAEALLLVSRARVTHRATGNGMPRTSREMQRWVREALSDPDEQLAVAVLPLLIARLDRCADVPAKEVAHG